MLRQRPPPACGLERWHRDLVGGGHLRRDLFIGGMPLMTLRERTSMLRSSVPTHAKSVPQLKKILSFSKKA